MLHHANNMHIIAVAYRIGFRFSGAVKEVVDP
jgi:hypothetical protein